MFPEVQDIPEVQRYGIAFGVIHKESTRVSGKYVLYEDFVSIVNGKNKEIKELKEELGKLKKEQVENVT